MKKTLALILTVLMAFSMLTMAVGAADTPITVVFKNEGEVLNTIHVASGTALTPYAPANPEKAPTETVEYIFKGWQLEGTEDAPLSRENLPTVVLAEDETSLTVTYVAVYAEEKIIETQSLLQFIASIFERINLIFQYFAEIFGI